LRLRTRRLAWAPCLGVRAVDRTHLLDDLAHLRSRHDILVRSQLAAALVGDRVLDVGEDLGLVRVRGEALGGGIEITLQRLVCRLLELVCIAIQVHDDDFLHRYLPRRVIVALISFQYSSSLASCARPFAVSA
jgi:hypothetical protein